MTSTAPTLALLLGLVTGCSTTEPFHADHSLLEAWSAKAQAARPDPPYATTYRAGGKTLVYVASRHEHEPGNATFATVSREFEALSPEVVIIEGMASSNGLSPAFYREWVASMPPDGIWPGGEAAWSASLAMARGIPFVGGEPAPGRILEGMESSPYGLQDLLGYFLVRQIPQWKRTRQDQDQDFTELFEQMMSQMQQAYEFDDSERFDVDEFRRWYERSNGRPFAYEQITTQEAAPLEGPDVLTTNRISVCEDRIRNTHIADVIADMLNRFDRVLIVYGAGHHVQQAAVLREMVGPPVEDRAAARMPPTPGSGSTE